MATTLREKRHRQCLDSIGRLTEQREHAFRRLAILQNRLADERRRLARLQKELPRRGSGSAVEAPAWKPEPLPQPPAWVPPPLYSGGNVTAPELPDLEIPDWLQRKKVADAKDAAAAAAIVAEQAERKAAKTKARIAKLKATQSGETRRMPLSGRAAMKAIRGE